MNLPEGSSDAVLCAQAFHWFADEAALVEIHRVLKREGRLELVWNVRDKSVDWVAAITDIIKDYEGNSPRYHKGEWRRPFAGGLFSGLEESCYN
jgi:ubiquinone/menaquinone biosynthesis C-methylase UbiE